MDHEATAGSLSALESRTRLGNSSCSRAGGSTAPLRLLFAMLSRAGSGLYIRGLIPCIFPCAEEYGERGRGKYLIISVFLRALKKRTGSLQCGDHAHFVAGTIGQVSMPRFMVTQLCSYQVPIAAIILSILALHIQWRENGSMKP